MAAQLTVLHVDDDPSFLGLTSRLFEREEDEVEVVTAATTEEAFEALDGGRFDCVVSDSIRTEEGESFVAVVRRRHPETPVVLFTGTEWEDLDPDAADAGLAGYVKKGGSAPLSSLAARVRSASRGGVDEGAGENGSDGSPHPGVGVSDGGGDDPGRPDDDASPDWLTTAAGWEVVAVHDWESREELVVTVVEAVERAIGPPESGQAPLYDAVNGELLEELLRPETTGSGVVVRFRYRGLDVAVAGNGEIAVRRRDGAQGGWDGPSGAAE